MFSEKDINQILNKGLTVNKINKQIELFKTGLPFINLESAATIQNGILQLSESEKQAFHYKICTSFWCSNQNV